MMQVRQMLPGEETAVLGLVLHSFFETVRAEFSAEGVAEFTTAAYRFLIDESSVHTVHVACAGDRLLGMIDVRGDSHICLMFVDPEHRAEGIGRALLASAFDAAAAGRPGAGSLTVNSTPSATGAYERLGFVATAPESEAGGIPFVPMRMSSGPAEG